jgi:hypothetical protein
MSAWAVCMGCQQLSKSRRRRGETLAELQVYDSQSIERILCNSAESVDASWLTEPSLGTKVRQRHVIELFCRMNSTYVLPQVHMHSVFVYAPMSCHWCICIFLCSDLCDIRPCWRQECEHTMAHTHTYTDVYMQTRTHTLCRDYHRKIHPKGLQVHQVTSLPSLPSLPPLPHAICTQCRWQLL